MSIQLDSNGPEAGGKSTGCWAWGNGDVVYAPPHAAPQQLGERRDRGKWVVSAGGRRECCSSQLPAP